MHKSHLLTSLTGWLLRAVTALVQLAAIRLVSGHLGIAQYAVFAVLSALWGWFQLADFGFGGAFLNILTHAKKEKHSEYIAYALHVIVVLSAVGIAFSVIVAPWIGHHLLPTVSGVSYEQKGHLLQYAALLMTLAAIWGISYRALFALDKGWISNLLQLIGTVGGLAGLYMMIELFGGHVKPSLSNVIITYWTPPMLMTISGYWYLLRAANGDAANGYRIKLYSTDKPPGVYRRAFKFFLIGIVAMAAVQSDLLIAAKILIPSKIATYAVVAKIFTLGYFACTSVTTALWPSLGRMCVAGEWQSLHGIMRRYFAFAIIVIITLTAILVVGRGYISSILLGKPSLNISLTVIVIFSIYTLTRAWTDFFAAAVSASDDLSFAFYCIATQAIISIALQIIFASRYGQVGLVLGAAAGFLLSTAWAFPLRFYMMRQKQMAML